MFKLLAALACTAVLLAGCGLTGDLYLPEEDEPGTETETASPTPPADEDNREAEADEG